MGDRRNRFPRRCGCSRRKVVRKLAPRCIGLPYLLSRGESLGRDDETTRRLGVDVADRPVEPLGVSSLFRRHSGSGWPFVMDPVRDHHMELNQAIG